MTINICGDFTTEYNGIKSVEENIAISSDILKLFGCADINVVNLEAPVANEKMLPIKKAGPSLSTTPKTIEYLNRCKVNMVTLANNHFCDYGLAGVDETIRCLEKNNISHIGGGRNNGEVKNIHYVEIKGVKVAFFNYCENEFSTLEDWGSNPLDTINVYHDLQKAKEIADKRIIIIHGGHEGYQLPSPRMKKLYHFFIDVGADVVINHHQHCYSGWEEYNNGVIFYGLGNFFFDEIDSKVSKIWNYGYIVNLNINNSLDVNYDVIPYKQCLEAKSTILLNDKEKVVFLKNIETINGILKDDEVLLSQFEKFCRGQANNTLTSFSIYQNRFLLALCRRGFLPNFLGDKKKLNIMNKLRCESHKDVASEVFKLMLDKQKNE